MKHFNTQRNELKNYLTTKDILQYVDDSVSNISHPPAVNQRV